MMLALIALWTLGVAIVVLLAILCIGLPIAWYLEDHGPRHRHRHRHQPPRRPVHSPGMPIPMWDRYEPPPPILIDMRAPTVPLDPIAAEIETEWNAKPWSPWELATGEFPAIIERMGQ